MLEIESKQAQKSNAKRMFIADLHHPGGRDEDVEEIFDDMPATVQQIFLLGDIFHFWVNDPDFIEERYGAFLQRLRKLAATGKDIFFQEGNRDFLARHYFEEEPWIDVLPNPHVIDLDGRMAYIGHGDELCWNDFRYQMFKTVIRSGPMRRLADRLPHRWKRKIARRLAEKSTELVAAKSQRELLIPTRAYKSVVRMGMDVIIHGHVHETYQREIQDGNRHAIVLAFGWQNGRRNVIYL